MRVKYDFTVALTSSMLEIRSCNFFALDLSLFLCSAMPNDSIYCNIFGLAERASAIYGLPAE